MDATSYATLRVERKGPVGWLVFDRPNRGNAMDARMMGELPRAWRTLEDDPKVGCIVVTGAGRTFQTGVDVAALAHDRDSLRTFSRRTRDAALEFTGWHLGVGTPIIAAVNGTCAGGGLHFVVDADIVIAADSAVFLDPHVSVGQASAWEAIGLRHRVAFTVAARLALVGAHERLSAARALQVGLVSEVVPVLDGDELERRAQVLGEIVAANPAARARKRALWRVPEVGLSAALARALDHHGGTA